MKGNQMKQIYHVQQRTKNRHVVDPDQGMVMRSELIMQPSGFDRIVRCHRDGHQEVYELQPDGTFMVPDEVAAEHLGRPGWHEGENPFFTDVEEVPATPPKMSKAGARAS